MSTKGREAAKIAAIIGGGRLWARRWVYCWRRSPERKRGVMSPVMPRKPSFRRPVQPPVKAGVYDGGTQQALVKKDDH